MKNKVNYNYWDNRGCYQTDLNRMLGKYVPATGKAETVIGEVLRAANNLYYEYFNNGNENALNSHSDDYTECWKCGGTGITAWGEECDECSGEGSCESTIVVEIDSRYKYYIDYILQQVSPRFNKMVDIMNSVREIIEFSFDCDSKTLFSEQNGRTYNTMMDFVVLWAKEKENEKV